LAACRRRAAEPPLAFGKRLNEKNDFTRTAAAPVFRPIFFRLIPAVFAARSPVFVFDLHPTFTTISLTSIEELLV